jgi:cystathionine beta-lyase/cystathionine gamma-synthase
MKVHSENAMALARLLENHPKVGKVYYPGLERQKTYGIARKVLEGGFGGMLSFELLADEAELNNFLENLELIELVPSLASVSTILSIPAKTSHRAVPEDVRLSKGISNSLIRLSVGIEPLEVIWKDISNSLDKLS